MHSFSMYTARMNNPRKLGFAAEDDPCEESKFV